MPKEEQEKKKPRIVKQIFKWIGLGLLTILLIAALVFQAPWKVTTLLAIILLACTILPKQLRKWFWAGVGAVVIALIVWVFLPEADGDWRPYTFDEELAAIEAKRAIPDEENAAIIYNQLLDSYDTNSFSDDFLVGELGRLIRFEPWSSKDYPEIAEWLRGHKSTIARLLEAAQMEKCRFPMAADSAKLSETMDRLAPMRRWAYLLVYAANNDLGEGRINQAIEKSLAIFGMSKHQYQQASIVDLLVGIALDALGHKQFNRIVMSNDTTEEHLSVIEDTLSKNRFNWSSDLPRILECEKLLARSMLSNFYEENPEGKTRLSQDPLVEARANAKVLVEDEEMKKMLTDEQMRRISKLSLPLTYWQRKLVKAGTVLGWFFMPSTPEKAGRIIDESYEKYYAMTEPNFDWEKGPREFSMTSIRFNYRYMVEHLTGILEPAYHRVHEIYLRLTTHKRGSWIIIALRRYKNQNGFWPVNLDDVKSMAPAEIFVDPINGGDFVYEITEENFRLYSKGKNNIDDGGRRERNAGTSCAPNWVDKGCDDWLIWPSRNRKEKEEGTNAEQQ